MGHSLGLRENETDSPWSTPPSVYKTGFATTQEAYERNYQQVFEGLAKVETLLSQKKWLVGDKLTEADIRLWTTIVRFDPVMWCWFGPFSSRMVKRSSHFVFVCDSCTSSIIRCITLILNVLVELLRTIIRTSCAGLDSFISFQK